MQYLVTRQIQELIDKGDIRIEDFDQKLLEKDHYRFRAFNYKYKGEVYDSIELGPQEYTVCLSFERFELPGNVVGDISQISNNALAGLIVNKSDYMDRCYEGRLRIGLFNMSENPITLANKMVVGKVYFYKIGNVGCFGAFDQKIDPSAPKTMLEKRLEHRAKSDDIEAPILGAGNQWY